MNARVRAIALDTNNVGNQRYNLYKKVIEHINKSIDNGYYLEAITLIESLIADRLESHLTFIKGEDFSFKTLDKIVKNFSKHKSDIDDDLCRLVEEDVNNWKDKRNLVLHEMAKIEINSELTWEEKTKDLEEIARVGFKIFRNIDKRLSYLRKNPNIDE